MIEPTIGRIVWIYGRPGAIERDKPEAAMVAACWPDSLVGGRWWLNVGGLDHDAHPFRLGMVPLVQDLADSDVNVAMPYATWMPYQKGQAAKTEALEAKLGTPK